MTLPQTSLARGQSSLVNGQTSLSSRWPRRTGDGTLRASVTVTFPNGSPTTDDTPDILVTITLYSGDLVGLPFDVFVDDVLDGSGVTVGATTPYTIVNAVPSSGDFYVAAVVTFPEGVAAGGGSIIVEGPARLLETGDLRLLETGDRRLMEA